MNCNRALLADYIAGRLRGDPALEILDHVEECRSCWQTLYEAKRFRDRNLYRKPNLIQEPTDFSSVAERRDEDFGSPAGLRSAGEPRKNSRRSRKVERLLITGKEEAAGSSPAEREPKRGNRALMIDETKDICREIQHTAKREARKHPDFYGQVTVHFVKGGTPKVVAQRHFLEEELDDEPGEGLVKKYT